MPATGANEGEEFKKAKQIRTPRRRQDEGATRCDYIKHPSNRPEPQTAATNWYQRSVVNEVALGK